MKERKATAGKQTSGASSAIISSNGVSSSSNEAPSPAELLDSEEAMAYLKTTRPTFSRWLKTGKLKGMKMGRQWRFRRAELDSFLSGGSQRIEAIANTATIISELSRRFGDMGAAWPPDGSELGRISLITEGIVALGSKLNASDIHLSMHPSSSGGAASRMLLRYRVDGILQPGIEIDSRLSSPIMDGFKSLANCDLNRRTQPQDGSIAMDLPKRLLGLGDEGRVCCNLRAQFLPSLLGESLTLRILDKGMRPELRACGFAPEECQRILAALNKPCGLVVFSGPTGSGKTMSLYACMLEEEKREGIKVVSVESPVESMLPMTTQISIGPEEEPLPFLRAAMRSDPDVVVLTELRNRAEMEMLQTIALTGHLVLASSHANSSVDAVQRLLEIGADAGYLADILQLMVSQRLVRRLCPHCCVKGSPLKEDLKTAAAIANDGGIDFSSLPKSYRKAVGCPKCSMTGYRGRMVVSESLEVNPEIRAAIRKGSSHDEILRLARAAGTTTLAAGAIRCFANGETSLHEALHAAK